MDLLGESSSPSFACTYLHVVFDQLHQIVYLRVHLVFVLSPTLTQGHFVDDVVLHAIRTCYQSANPSASSNRRRTLTGAHVAPPEGLCADLLTQL